MTPPTTCPPIMDTSADVVIVGASVSGCAVARALALNDRGRHRRIMLVDLHEDVSPRFAGELIHPIGVDALAQLGFEPALHEAHAAPVHGFDVYQRADSPPIELSYDLRPELRRGGLALHHKALVRAMRSVVAATDGIDFYPGTRVVGLLEEDATIRGVRLVDRWGRTHEVRCDTVIGADGKASSVRKLAGIEVERTQLGFTIGLELPLAPNEARNGRARVYLGAPGPMLLYPIQGGPHVAARARLTIDIPRHTRVKGHALRGTLDDHFLPHLPRPLGVSTMRALDELERHGRPLELAPTWSIPAPGAVRPGLALIGDAAGCSHPITASGMTIGLLDAMALAREAAPAHIRASRPWLHMSALRRYEHRHQKYVPTRQAVSEAIYECFCGESEGARAIQSALFAYWHASPVNRARSLALLSCAERRPRVFLSEYLKTANHAVQASLRPEFAAHLPWHDRLRTVGAAVSMAGGKLGQVRDVAWSQLRPSWW